VTYFTLLFLEHFALNALKNRSFNLEITLVLRTKSFLNLCTLFPSFIYEYFPLFCEMDEQLERPMSSSHGEGRRKPLDEGSAGPVVVENFGGGLCPAMDVSRLR
jgi:hypothetical protein